MMQDPAKALDAMVREELNIHPGSTRSGRAAATCFWGSAWRRWAT
jgi:hypothetical protein